MTRAGPQTIEERVAVLESNHHDMRGDIAEIKTVVKEYGQRPSWPVVFILTAGSGVIVALVGALVSTIANAA